MDKEKAEKIKKVLEEGQFNTIKHHQREGNPILISFADILTLINELETENECYKQSCGAIGQNSLTIINQQKDRIAELEKHIERVESERRRIKQDRDKKDELASKFIDSYNDSLKHFAERLKEKIVSMKWAREDTNEKLIKQGATIKAIDETLKEFLE